MKPNKKPLLSFLWRKDPCPGVFSPTIPEISSDWLFWYPLEGFYRLRKPFASWLRTLILIFVFLVFNVWLTIYTLVLSNICFCYSLWFSFAKLLGHSKLEIMSFTHWRCFSHTHCEILISFLLQNKFFYCYRHTEFILKG